VDELALEFAETAMRDQIQRCTDLPALKEIAISLLAANYAQKRMLGQLLLKATANQKKTS